MEGIGSVIHFPFPLSFIRRAAPTPIAAETSCPPISDNCPALDLTRFDTFTAGEIAALPKRLRLAVIADRKRRTTAALRRVVAGKPRAWK